MRRSLFMTGLVMLCLLLCAVGPAIAQIAPGVTAPAAHIANITGTIMQSDGTPVAGADVKLNGTAIVSTKSNDRGIFSFRSVPWGTYQIVVTSMFGTSVRSGVILSGDITVTIQYQAQNGLQTIAHVSTSGAGAHINVTSSSIASVNPSSYAFQGNTTWTQLFAQIPGVAVSGYALGGLLSSEVLVGNPQAPVILSLNGALPYETSTTLDGMPLQGTSYSESSEHVGGGVDLSTLPMNGFDTADIVRGPGANAPSIVDSVGGSFVLHAPGQVTSNHFEFSASNDPYGGIDSNAKVALHLGRLSATFIYGINDSPGPLGNISVIPAETYTPSTIGGQVVWAAAGGYLPKAYGIGNCYCAFSNTLLYCCLPVSTGWTAHSGAAALSYEITPSITTQIFYSGATSRMNLQGAYYATQFAPSATAPPYSGSIAPSPPGQTNYTLLHAGSPELYSQVDSLLEEKITAYFGSGVLRLAAVQNNSFNFEDNYGSPANGVYTVWGTAYVGASPPATPTAYNGISESLTWPFETVNVHFWTNNRDLLGSYAAQVGSASSIGVSYTTSYYNAPCIFDINYEGFPFNESQSSAVSETTNETRVHVDTQLADGLSLGLSWYFAEGSFHVPLASNPNYWTTSTFPYNAPRFGAVWEANPNVAVRAAIGGGYALPVLSNLIGFPISCSFGECYQTAANPNLKPEETMGFDLGTDVRFHRNTVLSLDLYRTNLYGQFFTSDTLSSYNGMPLYITQFGNIGTSVMEGINLDVRHDVPTGVYWHGTLGFTRGYVISVPSGFYNNPSIPCTYCTNQDVIPGPNFTSSAFSATVPYASASAQLGYRWTPGKYFDLQPTYYGNNNIYNTPKALIALDAHGGYAITRNVSILATFRNITGVYDRSVQYFTPGFAVPVIPGTEPLGGQMELPYGPRSVVVTADFQY